MSQAVCCEFAGIWGASVLSSLLLYLRAGRGSLCHKHKRRGVGSGVSSSFLNCGGHYGDLLGGSTWAPPPSLQGCPFPPRACIATVSASLVCRRHRSRSFYTRSRSRVSLWSPPSCTPAFGCAVEKGGCHPAGHSLGHGMPSRGLGGKRVDSLGVLITCPSHPFASSLTPAQGSPSLAPHEVMRGTSPREERGGFGSSSGPVVEPRASTCSSGKWALGVGGARAPGLSC